jgi:hypothetical protein
MPTPPRPSQEDIDEVRHERRKHIILHELAEPPTTESIFIAVAQLTVALSDARSRQDKREVFKEAMSRMMDSWLNDDMYWAMNDGTEMSPTWDIAATRKDRRKEVTQSDIERIIVIANKLGL